MQRFWRTIALSIVVGAFVSLDYVIWFTLHLPFGIDAENLEVNRTLVPWQMIIRITLTVILVWTFLYLRAHCVIASREESTRIVTKG